MTNMDRWDVAELIFAILDGKTSRLGTRSWQQLAGEDAPFGGVRFEIANPVTGPWLVAVRRNFYDRYDLTFRQTKRVGGMRLISKAEPMTIDDVELSDIERMVLEAMTQATAEASAVH